MKNEEVKEEYTEKIRQIVSKLNDLKYTLVYRAPTEEEKALIDLVKDTLK